MRKSYNPFKMWGSYVGLILVIILFLGVFQTRFFITDKENSCSNTQPPTHFAEGDNQAKYIASQQIYLSCLWTTKDNTHSLYNYYGTCNCHFLSFTAPFLYLIFRPVYAFFTLIIGFLIGWAIHSLARKLRR